MTKKYMKTHRKKGKTVRFKSHPNQMKKASLSMLKKHLPETSREAILRKLLEIVRKNKLPSGVFFLSSYIFEAYYFKAESPTKLNEINLVSLSTLFLAIQRYFPMKSDDFLKVVGKGIKRREFEKIQSQMTRVLGENFSKFSGYDAMKLFLYDLEVNNREKIRALGIKPLISEMKKMSVFLMILIKLESETNSIPSSLTALSCLIVSFDVVRSVYQWLAEKEQFITEWLNFIISNANTDKSELEYLYNKIATLYNKYKNRII